MNKKRRFTTTTSNMHEGEEMEDLMDPPKYQASYVKRSFSLEDLRNEFFHDDV